MKKIFIFGLVMLLFSSSLIFAVAQSEIIYPRVEIVNKTQANSVEVTEILPNLPLQKVSEITLKSNEFTIFKQKQAGDYILMTVVDFKKEEFLANFYKMMLSFHSEKSAEFAFYNLDNKLIIQKVSIAKDREEKLDLNLDGNTDIVLGYLGYDVNNLPSFKVKAYMPEGTLYYNGHYCKLTENKDKYKCYKEDPGTGKVAESYEISAADLQLAGSTIDKEVQDIVKKEAIEKKNAEINQSVTEEMQKTQIGEQKTEIPWEKLGFIGIILILITIGYIGHKKMKKKNEQNNHYGGNY